MKFTNTNMYRIAAICFFICYASAYSWHAGGVVSDSAVIRPVDNDHVLIFSYDPLLKIYNKARVMDLTNKSISNACYIETQSPFCNLLPKRNLIVYENPHGDIVLKNFDDGKIIFKRINNENSGLKANFSRSGDSLIIFDELSRNFTFYNINTENYPDSLSDWSVKNIDSSSKMILSNHFETIYFQTKDTLNQWSVSNKEFQKSWTINRINKSGVKCFSEDNSKLYFASTDGHLRVYNFEADSLTADIFDQYFHPQDIRLSHNGRFIMTDSITQYNKIISKYWDLESPGYNNPKIKNSYDIGYLSDDGAKGVLKIADSYLGPGIYSYKYAFNIQLVDLPYSDSALVQLTYPYGNVALRDNRILFNKTGSIMCVSGPQYDLPISPNPTLFNATIWRTADSTLIKYLKLSGMPLAMSPDATTLLMATYYKLYFHDISKDKILDSLETDLISINQILIDSAAQYIFCLNPEKLEIFSYKDRQLIKTVNPAENHSKFFYMKLIEDNRIAVFENGVEFVIYNYVTDKTDTTDIYVETKNPKVFLDISDDGNYLLLIQDSIETWDLVHHKKVYSVERPNNFSGQRSFGFLPGNFSFWFFWDGKDSDYMPKTGAVNMAKNVEYGLHGQQNIMISPDKKHYASFYCPGEYYYESIPDYLLTGVDEFPQNFENKLLVYPNPVTDNLKIRLSGYESENVDIRIIDALGREVMKAENVFASEMDLPVGNIVSGVYYILVKTSEKNQRAKFIKI